VCASPPVAVLEAELSRNCKLAYGYVRGNYHSICKHARPFTIRGVACPSPLAAVSGNRTVQKSYTANGIQLYSRYSYEQDVLSYVFHYP